MPFDIWTSKDPELDRLAGASGKNRVREFLRATLGRAVEEFPAATDLLDPPVVQFRMVLLGHAGHSVGHRKEQDPTRFEQARQVRDCGFEAARHVSLEMTKSYFPKRAGPGF